MPSRINEAKLPTSKAMPSNGMSGDGFLAKSIKNNKVATIVAPEETVVPKREMYLDERSFSKKFFVTCHLEIRYFNVKPQYTGNHRLG